MKTKCLIVDDEPLARDLIRRYLEKIGHFEIVAECSDAVKTLQIIRKTDIDLMFMDIHMPHISGIDFLKTLKNPPKVIITTAHSEFAINGFDLDVTDYLLKPVSFQRFLKAVNKFYRHEKRSDAVTSLPLPKHDNEDFIYVKGNRKVIKLFLDEILYIEGLSEYVRLHTKKENFVVKTTMTKMETELAGKGFLRIHRSYIVSYGKIKAFTPSSVDIRDKQLPVSRTYKNAVLAVLNTAGVENFG